MPETVNLRDETTGQTFGVPLEQVAAYKAQGFREEAPEERVDRLAAETFHEQHGGVGGAIGSGIVGGLSGLTLGGSDLALGALGADRVVRHMEEEHPYATGGGTVIGALAPAILTGGATAGESAAGLGARILARTPAGLAGKLGGAIGGLGEGAGLAGRVAAGTAGAAAEGALYGGGQYLTETALENKPLSAEGFVAGMGHGALFAAPIGGATTLAAGTLQRARSLFPRSEVSAAAAAGVKEEASGALAQTVRDGDEMAAAAERKLSDVDAKAQMAQAGETVTRRVFGEAHPQALADQVTGAVDRQQVAQALEGYQQARQQFDDWLANEADPAFAAAVGRLDANQPALDRMLGHADQGDLETLLSSVHGGSTDEKLQAALRRSLGEPDVVGSGGVPLGEFSGKRLARGTPHGAAPAIEPSQDLTKPFDISETPLRFDPERRQYFNMDVPAEPMGGTELRGGAKGTPVGEVPAQEIVQRGMASEQPAATPASGPLEIRRVKEGRKVTYEAKMPDGTTRTLADRGEVSDLVNAQLPPEFQHSSALETHRDLAVEHGLPKDAASIRENALYVVRPSELADHGILGNEIRPDAIALARKTVAEGTRIPPVEIDIAPNGEMWVVDGNHRLQVNAELGDRPVAVKFRASEAPKVRGEGRNPVIELAPRLREAMGARATAPVAAPGDNLLAALSGTKSAIDKGAELVDIGGKEAAATRAEQLARHPETAERFLAKAGASDAAASFRAKASGPDLDAFFRDLTAPKTRDAYVAANIGRAMREEGGSHAAALAKVEREWGERITAELREERAAVLEYEGGYSRADAERMARDEVAGLTRGHGTESASPGEPVVWQSKKNLRRVEAAKKAADASVERLREIHSAVASNLPEELQTAWREEGYKFLREESARIRGVKDRISAASKISESFTEKYGSASETGRGYEGDRFHRRADIESRHAESWAKEQERKYYAALERAANATDPAERAAAAQESQVIKRQLTQTGTRPGSEAGAPAAEGGEAAKIAERARHVEEAERARIAELDAKYAAEPEVGDATMRRMLGDLAGPAPAAAGTEPDALGARILRNESRPSAVPATSPVSDAAVRGEGQLAGPMSKAEIAAQRDRFRALAPEQRAAKAIMRHNGKDADMGPGLARAAKAIGDMEEASAKLTDVLGSEAPASAIENAKAYRKATGKAQEQAAASSAKAAADLKGKVPAAQSALAEPAAGVGGRLADAASALEILRAIGTHVPALSHIPVIGPVLGLFFKARAVMSILGRKGGSIGKSTESVIAGKAAATRDRIVKATGALLEGGARAAGKASHLAGPAALLADSLFPGGDKPKSDKPRDLFDARVNDIVRAQQPGAIDQAIAQRYPTSDPELHDAIVAQVQRGIAFLDSKRPKETVLPGILPGDGHWKPSMAAIEEFGKYVHAVNDPISVLEDLAKGHPSAEGAETLRVVYPELYRYGQKELLAAAPEMAKTLPYARRVMISILYQIPVDGTMHPSHAAYIQTPAPAPAAPHAPSSSGPLRLGQQTLSPLDKRAGA